MDISYRPARPEDLEEGERVCLEAGNELRVRHGGRAGGAGAAIDRVSEILPGGGSERALGRGTR